MVILNLEASNSQIPVGPILWEGEIEHNSKVDTWYIMPYPPSEQLFTTA